MSQNAYVPPVGPAREIEYVGADFALPAGTALGSNATKHGTLTPSRGAKSLVVNGQASQAGTMTLTGYADAAGAYVAWTVSGITVAATPLILTAPDGIPFEAWKPTFTNTNTTAGTCQVNAASSQA